MASARMVSPPNAADNPSAGYTAILLLPFGALPATERGIKFNGPFEAVYWATATPSAITPRAFPFVRRRLF